MKKLKKIAAFSVAAAMMAGTPMTVMAAWQQNTTGWWWQNEDGSWPANSWKWLDGNGDGVSECYYFNENGYILADTTTPDGYTVNANGAWIENGTVQTQAAQPVQVADSDTKTGYNSNSISNAAIDILTHKQEENTKYGEIRKARYLDPGFGSLTAVQYSNGLWADYYDEAAYYADGYPFRVYSDKPGNIINGLPERSENVDQDMEILKNLGFENVFSGAYTVYSSFFHPDFPLSTTSDNYFITWGQSSFHGEADTSDYKIFLMYVANSTDRN